MKWLLIRAFIFFSCFTQLYGINNELSEQAWFVYPWEKFEQEYKKNQEAFNLSVHDIPECKNNLPEWITDAWVNQLIAYSKESIKVKDISLMQESEGIDAIALAQGLDESFKQALKIYSRTHTGLNPEEPFDIFLSCFVSEGGSKFFTCIFSPTAERYQIKLKPKRGVLLKDTSLITHDRSSDFCVGILFVSLAYGVLLAIAYLGEGASA